MGFIYKITNIISKKVYIGQTKEVDPIKRWKGHQAAFSKNAGCPALRDAVKKYGIENFKFEVIIICFDEDRFKYEKEYIIKYNSLIPNGYNILEGGIGGRGFKGKKHTEETKIKIKESQKEIWTPEKRDEQRKKSIEALKNNTISERMKQSEKWKNAIKGKRCISLNEETKEKIKKSVIQYYLNSNSNILVNIEKHRDSMCKAVGRSIRQYTENNEFIKEYPSIAQAGRDSGIKKNNILHVLKGTSRLAGGFIWKYSEERPKPTG